MHTYSESIIFSINIEYYIFILWLTYIIKYQTWLCSKGSSQPKDQTQVSHIVGRFFTSWVTRGPQEYLSGYPIPSPADHPNLGIEPGYPALQPGSLPAELPGKPLYFM